MPLRRFLLRRILILTLSLSPNPNPNPLNGEMGNGEMGRHALRYDTNTNGMT